MPCGQIFGWELIFSAHEFRQGGGLLCTRPPHQARPGSAAVASPDGQYGNRIRHSQGGLRCIFLLRGVAKRCEPEMLNAPFWSAVAWLGPFCASCAHYEHRSSPTMAGGPLLSSDSLLFSHRDSYGTSFCPCGRFKGWGGPKHRTVRLPSGATAECESVCRLYIQCKALFSVSGAERKGLRAHTTYDIIYKRHVPGWRSGKRETQTPTATTIPQAAAATPDRLKSTHSLVRNTQGYTKCVLSAAVDYGTSIQSLIRCLLKEMKPAQKCCPGQGSPGAGPAPRPACSARVALSLHAADVAVVVLGRLLKLPCAGELGGQQPRHGSASAAAVAHSGCNSGGWRRGALWQVHAHTRPPPPHSPRSV